MKEVSFEPPVSGRVTKSRWRRIGWVLLLLVVAIAFTSIFIPAWLIMPFKAQTARGVSLSYALKSWSPVATLITALAALALSIWLWQGARWFGRIVVIVLLIPVFVSFWFARQNHFEWMFNPLPNPGYAKVGEADFLGARDMVMLVVINGEAVAYPVRQMGYHHVVQDRVGGIQVVTTY